LIIAPSEPLKINDSAYPILSAALRALVLAGLPVSTSGCDLTDF
jgi:hypothetical protein